MLLTATFTCIISAYSLHLVAGKKFLCIDISVTQRNFFATCNSIFSSGKGVDEIALLTLQESYSLSVLMYVAAVLTLKAKQIYQLNVCWNVVIRKIFGYNKIIIIIIIYLLIKHRHNTMDIKTD